MPQLPQLPAMISPPKSTEAETFGSPDFQVSGVRKPRGCFPVLLPRRQTPLTKEQEIKGALATEEGEAVIDFPNGDLDETQVVRE